MKKTLTILLIAALAASLNTSAFAIEPGFENFIYSGEYITGQFRDVTGTEWFSQYVEDSYNFGFFKGKSPDVFDPGGLLTLGEAVTLAARLRSIYYTGSADFPETTPYYEAYADYALSNGIITNHFNYNEPANRAQFSQFVCNALPSQAYLTLNSIPDYGICDVPADADFGAAVYTLYRAGVLTGSDQYGTFNAHSNITRAEACAVMVRIAYPAARVRMLLPAYIPAEVIFTRSADAVFMIETFDNRGNSIRIGSGFFISDDGKAITNLHVIENAASAVITLNNGDTLPIRGVLAISEEYNLAMLSIDPGISGSNYLRLADSSLVETGNLIYTISSPRGLINSITEGVVSHINRINNGALFIQFTAPISFGSGGSPLLNSLGQVIGVASSHYNYGQSLNLAVPVNFVKTLTPGQLTTLEELYNN